MAGIVGCKDEGIESGEVVAAGEGVKGVDAGMRVMGRSAGAFAELALMRAGDAILAESVPGYVRDVLPAISSGIVKPVIDKVYPFAELPAAKAHMEAAAHVGKIILKI